jgi:hypothetical protein
MTKKCIVCGADMEEEGCFCQVCGADQRKAVTVCKVCQKKYQSDKSDDDICDGCRKAFENDYELEDDYEKEDAQNVKNNSHPTDVEYCIFCGAQNEKNFKFCEKCGAAMERRNEAVYEPLKNPRNVLSSMVRASSIAWLIVGILQVCCIIFACQTTSSAKSQISEVRQQLSEAGLSGTEIKEYFDILGISDAEVNLTYMVLDILLLAIIAGANIVSSVKEFSWSSQLMYASPECIQGKYIKLSPYVSALIYNSFLAVYCILGNQSFGVILMLAVAASVYALLIRQYALENIPY